MAMIVEERLAHLPTLRLSRGLHKDLSEGACAMELTSWLAGEPWSNWPACVSPVLSAFVGAWNDSLPDQERNALIPPLILRLIGTRAAPPLEARRATLAADWLVRVHAPASLRLASSQFAALAYSAQRLSSLPAIEAFAQVPTIRGALEAARLDAAAARGAIGLSACTRAWEVIRSAGEAAACAAAWNTADDRARALAWNAAWEIARDAARATPWDTMKVELEQTRRSLTLAALALVERMIFFKT